jgi:DNA-binding MarR family transcriptional regulator
VSESAEPGVERVADRLHSAAIHLLRALRRVDPGTGVSGARLSALSVVVYAGPLTHRQLADAEQVRGPTMTAIVRRLEEAGLVTREVDPADRRIVRVRATADGVRVLERGRALRLQLLSDRLRALPPDDLAILDRAADLIERTVRSG